MAVDELDEVDKLSADAGAGGQGGAPKMSSCTRMQTSPWSPFGEAAMGNCPNESDLGESRMEGFPETRADET